MCAASNEDNKERTTDESAEKNGENSDETGEQSVPEPYAGFFNDMKRMGLSENEAKEQAKKQQKRKTPNRSDRVGRAKNLFRPDGTPYAPWMANFPTEYDASIIKKRTDATGRLAADPQLGELSGVGLTYRMVGDSLKLIWSTGLEEDNLGFAVYRRRGKSPDWEKLADYRSEPQLKSKGSKGGSYNYLIEEPESGTWVYRVSDVDSNENVCDLSQVLVEIDSAEDKKSQKIALIGLLAALVIAAVIGLLFDPQF